MALYDVAYAYGKRFPWELRHVPHEQIVLGAAYLELRFPADDGGQVPNVGKGEAQWTPLHHERAKAAEARNTEKMRAAKAARRRR